QLCSSSKFQESCKEVRRSWGLLKPNYVEVRTRNQLLPRETSPALVKPACWKSRPSPLAWVPCACSDSPPCRAVITTTTKGLFVYHHYGKHALYHAINKVLVGNRRWDRESREVLSAFTTSKSVNTENYSAAL
ncbi:unnamed protein product, partial [Discosporangium mesarthrocarpum]